MDLNSTKTSRADKTRSTNHEGGQSFDPATAEMSLAKHTINNLLEDNFYTDDETQLEELKLAFDAAADEDPEFVLQLASEARNKMGLRDVSQVLLVLAANDDRTKEYVRDYGSEIMARADEPCTVIAAHDMIGSGSLPKCLRDAIEDALHNFDLYQFDKYNKDSREVNLKDVVNRVHPKPRDELREEAFERLMKGEKSNYPEVEPLNEAQGATWETVISEKGNTEEAWREVLDRMGIMAKLRNMRSIMDSGISSDEILTEDDLDSIRNSRMFPFRIYQSYNAVKDAGIRDRYFDKWMSTAIDTTTENLPNFLTNTLCVADVSRSMVQPVSERSNMTVMEIATLFTASVGKKGAQPAAFADVFEKVDAHVDTPTLELQDKIKRSRPSGSTNGYKVIRNIRQNEEVYDRVVMFTDMQLWNNDGYYADSTLKDEWDMYKENVAPEAKLYLIDLSNYADLQFPEGYEDVYNISGWTSKVIDFIDYAEKEDEFIERVKSQTL